MKTTKNAYMRKRASNLGCWPICLKEKLKQKNNIGKMRESHLYNFQFIIVDIFIVMRDKLFLQIQTFI